MRMIRGMAMLLISMMLLTGCSSREVQNNITEKASLDQETFLVDQQKAQKDVEQKQEEVKASMMPKDEKKEKEEQLSRYIEQMSQEEKVGQLFMVAVRKGENDEPVLALNDEMKTYISDYHVGGMILFSENIKDSEQVKTLISHMQQAAQIPLFIGVDEEGGIVSRVGKVAAINEQPFMEAYSLGKSGDLSKAYSEAQRMGQLLFELGFNMDFAPVADIYNEKQNTVIGTRSFGTSHEVVTPMVLAFARGLREKKILPVIKHFPGHGNTVQDSHSGMAYVNKTLEALEEEELIPFLTALEEGNDAVMKGHLLVSSVDAVYPASLSETWQNYLSSKVDVSRTLFVTDALNMGAITSKYTSSEAAILAIKAGNDLLLMPENFIEAYEGVMSAVANGTLSEEQIDQAVNKILSKKIAQDLVVLS